METSHSVRFTSIIIYLDINNIKSGGCQYLSKAEWANLAHLNLCKSIIYSEFNDIGANGCQYLSSAKWTNNITHLYLSNSLSI